MNEYTNMDLIVEVVDTIILGGLEDYEANVDGKFYMPCYTHTYPYLTGLYEMYMRLRAGNDNSDYIITAINFIELIKDDAYNYYERKYNDPEVNPQLAARCLATQQSILCETRDKLYKFLEKCEQELL
jgi:hypothetical protein